ncbi:MAG: hypothetical protein GY820_21800 [Gammaproteobacteria bacterium]|nr:hypothetical protein [Gammaproteobacteria bacterium]
MISKLNGILISLKNKEKSIINEIYSFNKKINELKIKLDKIRSLPKYSSKILSKIELLNNSYLNPGNDKIKSSNESDEIPLDKIVKEIEKDIDTGQQYQRKVSSIEEQLNKLDQTNKSYEGTFDLY